jgi:hypothetical protein
VRQGLLRVLAAVPNLFLFFPFFFQRAGSARRVRQGLLRVLAAVPRGVAGVFVLVKQVN